jgi:hypothetical protein
MRTMKLEKGNLYELRNSVAGEVWTHLYTCSPGIKTLDAAVAEFDQASFLVCKSREAIDKRSDNARLIALLESVLAEIMEDLDKDISFHTASLLSDEMRFLSKQIKALKE